jgi:hypothetical protein
MPSHRLIAEHGPKDAEWRLEWNDAAFRLEDPDGRPVIQADDGKGHRLVDLYDLLVEGKISISTPAGGLAFKKNRDAIRELKAYVESGLRSDDEYRIQLKADAARAIPRGLLAFFGGGVPFGLYCWMASWAPDPPPGHWVRWFGGLIHLVLLVLLGTTIAGLVVCLFGLRQWRRIRRIERELGDDSPGERRES